MLLGQSRIYRVTQLRTDGVHCRESAGIGPVILKVVPVTGAAILQVTMDQLMCASLFLHPLSVRRGCVDRMRQLYRSMGQGEFASKGFSS